MRKKIAAVYRVTNTVNGSCYIGSSLDYLRRKLEHLRQLRSGTSGCRILQNAWNKYGDSAFEWDVLSVVDNERSLVEREKHFIDTLRPRYNTMSAHRSVYWSVPHLTAGFKLAQRVAKSGEKNPQWKGDRATEKAGRSRAQKAFPEKRPCERCGAKMAERHHRDGNTLNNEPTNIEWLCRRCHMIADGRLEKFKLAGIEGGRLGRERGSAFTREKQYCKRGHALFGENVRVNAKGSRVCRTCARESARRYKGIPPERWKLP